jgi:hypothetical protein
MKHQIEFDPLPALLEDTGRQAPGVVCLANEERFTAAHFSEPLTAYAVGWTDPENIRGTLDAMCPRVDVSRRFEFKQALNAESFLSEADDIRAIGSPFKRVEFKGSSTNERTLNKGLTMRLDRDDLVPGQEERDTARLIARLYRNDLRRAAALIVAAATNTNKTWDTTALKDPDADVLADLITSGDARGINPNTVVYGETAWQKRSLSHRAQNTAGGFASASLTPEALAQLLGVARVLISRERYQSGAATKTKIVSAYVLMYFAQGNISKDDPSDVKQFVTPTESGDVRVYREEHAKYIDITVEHYSNIVMTGSTGVRMFTVS